MQVILLTCNNDLKYSQSHWLESELIQCRNYENQKDESPRDAHMQVSSLWHDALGSEVPGEVF